MFANNLSLKNTILVNTPLPTYKHLSPGSWKVPRLEEAFFIYQLLLENDE